MKKAKTAIIFFHRSDYDGLFSGFIAKSKLQEDGYLVTSIGWTYGMPIPKELKQRTWDIVVVVDLSFPPEIMDNIENLVWIDHHDTSIKDSKPFKFFFSPGKRILGKGACELAWEYFYPGFEVPLAIQYLSAYDVHDMKRFDWEGKSLPLQYALKAMYGNSKDPLFEEFVKLTHPGNLNRVDELIETGKIVLQYARRMAEIAVKNYGFVVTVNEKYSGLCIITTDFKASLYTELMIDKYDVLVLVNRKRSSPEDIFIVGFYSEEGKLDFSLGDYAKEIVKGTGRNGGGHKCASGCEIDKEQFLKLISSKKI